MAKKGKRKKNQSSESISSVAPICYVLSAIFIILGYVRIHYGIDFSDEGQAMSEPYGYLIGLKPFVNEMFFQQTAAFLFTPFIYMYHLFFGTEGIVLFGRHVFMFLSLFASYCVYLLARNYLDKPLSFFLSAATYTYVPFSVASVNYNRIIYLCFVAGLFLGSLAIIKKSRIQYFITGFIFGLGVFSYPPILIAVAVFMACTTFSMKTKNEDYKTFLKFVFLGGVIPCTLGALLLLSFGVDNLKAAMEFSKNFNALGGLKKFGEIAMRYQEWFPALWKVVCIFALGLFGHLSKKFSFYWPFIIFPVVIVTDPNSLPYFCKSQYLSIFFLSCVFPLLVHIRVRHKFEPILFNLLLTSFVGGILMAWSSGNGLPNAGVGFFPGVIVSVLIMAKWINEKSEFKFGARFTGYFVLLSCLSIGGSVLYSTYTYMYRDDVVAELKTRVPSGPFAGMITSRQRAEFISQVQEDVNQFAKGRKSIFFYDHFPAGYLFSNLKPMCKVLFMHPPNYMKKLRPIFLEFYSHPENMPDIVFEFYAVRFGKDKLYVFNPPDKDPFKDPFKAYFAKNPQYSVVKKRQLYRVLVRKSDENQAGI